MLREHGKALWLAEGPTVRFLGLFPYPTRMAVARFADGGLWVWSPVELTPALAAEVEALGPVRHLVAPNKLHHLFLGAWAERFPEARLHAPPGLAARRRDLHFHSELGDEAVPAWEGEICHVVFRGSLFMDEVVFFHRASRTVLVADLIQRMDPEALSGLAGWILRVWGLTGPNGSTPREWRALWWNRAAGRKALETALGWNAERLVIAHGMLPTEPGRAALARGLRWLR